MTQSNIPYFNDVKDFEEFYNNYLDATVPNRKRIKPGKKTFNLTKRKTVKKRIERTEVDANGVPRIIVDQHKETKPVPDTNGFTKLVIAYLESAWGCNSARRISSEGRFRPDKNNPKGGTWLPGQNNGIEDVQAILRGKLVAIEVKYTKTDKMRPEQLKRREEVISDGGVYIVARNFEQLQKDLIEKIFNN